MSYILLLLLSTSLDFLLVVANRFPFCVCICVRNKIYQKHWHITGAGITFIDSNLDWIFVLASERAGSYWIPTWEDRETEVPPQRTLCISPGWRPQNMKLSMYVAPLPSQITSVFLISEHWTQTYRWELDISLWAVPTTKSASLQPNYQVFLVNHVQRFEVVLDHTTIPYFLNRLWSQMSFKVLYLYINSIHRYENRLVRKLVGSFHALCLSKFFPSDRSKQLIYSGPRFL